MSRTKLSSELLVVGYKAGVRHPEVSGMEHLHLLQIRSKLAYLSPELTLTQREQIRQADQELLAKADKFLVAIQQIADLASWRVQENAPPTHWWWYLDVVVSLPGLTMTKSTSKRLRQTVPV